MKNIFTTTAILVAVTAGNTVNAQGMSGDFYASVFGGYSTSEISTDYSSGPYSGDIAYESDSGYVLGVTVGTTVAPNIRAEAEVSYAGYSIGSGSINYTGPGGSGSYSFDIEDDFTVNTTYLLANVWYDVAGAGGASGVMPYVGGGLGLGIVSAAAESPGGDDVDLIDAESALAYQFGAGVRVPLGAGMVDVGYRYKAFTGAAFDDGVFLSDEEADGASSSFQAGYVFKF